MDITRRQGWRNKKEWLSKVRATAPAVANRLEAEFAVASDQMVSLAKQLCPVQADKPFHKPPGTLRDSIRSEVTSIGPGRFMTKVIAADGDAYYGRFVEFGTRAGVKGGVYFNERRQRDRKIYRTHPGTTAHPFFWPAFHQTVAKVYRDLNALVGDALKDAVS
jgi:HK97 gp10 family phage protein